MLIDMATESLSGTLPKISELVKDLNWIKF